MHVAIYHDALIPPPNYGGTERVICWLTKALLELGHPVSLIAKPGSQLPGARSVEISGQPAENWEQLIPRDADIIHLWATPRVLPRKPFLVTIEGNGQLGELFHPNTVFVSRKHAENHGSRHFVYNGIDPDDFECEETRENYFVFLAKASWKVKNLKGAIDLARKAKVELKVMGTRTALPWKWRGIQSLGMVDDLKKRALLKKAKGLFFPVRWHEPFGIAITEALASGCPVYGTPYGSLPEIITPDVGFLSHRADELLRALTSHPIAPATCRQRVIKHFSHRQMAQRYLEYYNEILIQGGLNQNGKPPQSIFTSSANELLPWESPT